MSWGMTRDEKVSVEMTPCLSREVVLIGKSVRTTSSGNEKSDRVSGRTIHSSLTLREKYRSQTYISIVPITDTGGLVG